MEESALPTIVVEVQLGCCNACTHKLQDLLVSTKGVKWYEIKEEANMVVINGFLDMNQAKDLAQKIGKKLHKKGSRLKSYELPKPKSPPKEPKKKEDAPSKKESHPTQVENQLMLSSRNHSPSSHHGPPNPHPNPHHPHPPMNLSHYGPPRPSPHYPHPSMNLSHHGPSHYGPSETSPYYPASTSRDPVPAYPLAYPYQPTSQHVAEFDQGLITGPPSPPLQLEYGYHDPVTSSWAPPPPRTQNGYRFDKMFSDDNPNAFCMIM